MTIDDEIRDRIYGLLEGGTVDAFEEWFVSRSWDERTPLVAAVNHLFAESDVLEHDDLVIGLKELGSRIELNPRRELVVASSSATTLRRRVRIGGNQTITRRLEFADR